MRLKTKATNRIITIILLCTTLIFIQNGLNLPKSASIKAQLPTSASMKTDTVSGSEDLLPNFFLPSDNPPEVRFDWELTITYPSTFNLGYDYSIQIHLTITNFKVENGQLKSAIIQYEPVVDGFPFEQSQPKEINCHIENSWQFTYNITKKTLENKEDIAYLSNGQSQFHCKGIIIGVVAENGEYGAANYVANMRSYANYYISLATKDNNFSVSSLSADNKVNTVNIFERYLLVIGLIGLISLISIALFYQLQHRQKISMKIIR